MGVTSTPTSMFVGSRPYQSALFNTYFKVKKKVRVVLDPGATHRHNYSHTPNRYIDTSRVSTSSVTTAKRGLTTSVLLVVHGEPVNAVGTQGSADVVSSGPAKIDFVWTETYTYKYIQGNVRTLAVVDSLSKIIVPEGLTDTDMATAGIVAT